jgi:CBS domain-containing protein
MSACPFCGHDNLPGTAECESCGQDLTAVSNGSEPSGRLHGALLGTLGDVPVIGPLAVAQDGTVRDAVELMRAQGHGSVLVMDGDRLVGIFTEKDLVRRVDPRADLAKVCVAEVMTRNPRTYRTSRTITYALNGMAIRGHRHLPIVDEHDRVLGVVSVRKVLAHIRDTAGL